MAFALHRATPAIVASADRHLGMLCLAFAELNSTAGLGPVSAIGIAVGLLAMITLLPALLVIFGRWMFWPRRPTSAPTSRPPRHRARVGAFIKPRPRTVWIIATLALGVCILGVFTLNTNGLPPRTPTPRSSTR